MSTPALNPLVEKVRAVHPGAYDDMDDATLTKRVLAKYPQYSDLAAPGVQRPTPPELKPGMTMTQGHAMPYSKAVESGPLTPPGQAEGAMGFGSSIEDQNKTELQPIALGAATAAPILSGGLSIPAQMAIGGISGAAQSKLQGGSNTEAAISGGIGATLPAAAPVMSELGQSAKVIGKAAGKAIGTTAEELPVVGAGVKGIKAGVRALGAGKEAAGGLRDIWGAKPVYPGASLGPEAPPADVIKGIGLAKGAQSAEIAQPAEALKTIAGPKPVYPGAPLPEAPELAPKPLGPESPPEGVLKGRNLGVGPTSVDVLPPQADALKTIAGPHAVYPGAPLPAKPDLAAAPLGPETPPPGVLKASSLGAGPSSFTPKPEPADVLGKIPPTRPHIAPPMSQKEVGQKLGSELGQGLGAKPIENKPNVPVKDQFKVAGPSENKPAPINAGSSTAVDSFHYDPAKQEMHVKAKDGITHVYGDVSQDQADAFRDNPSKGRAWQELQKSSSVKVAKISPEGTRTPNKGAVQFRSASPEATAPDDLEGKMRESLRLLKKTGKKAPIQ